MWKKFVRWFVYSYQPPDGWTPLQATICLVGISPFLYILWLVAQKA